MVGKVFDSFEVIGPRGNHECLLYQPLGMSFTEFLKFLPLNRLSEHLTQRSVQLLLIALEYLHRCYIVHTGMPPARKIVRS